MSAPDRPRRLLIGACGAANVLTLPAYLTALGAELGSGPDPRLDVAVIMTHSAARFLSPDAVRLITPTVVAPDEPPLRQNHVDWARWPDLFLVLPATAHMLAAGAHGLADGLLATTLLAYEGPVTYFPSMNPVMAAHPAVQRNVTTLRTDGHQVIMGTPASSYEAATGSYTQLPGMPAPSAVVEYVRRALKLDQGRP